MEMENIFCKLDKHEKTIIGRIKEKNIGIERIAIMPDAHPAGNCLVGFTARFAGLNSKIDPDIIGSYIGCGVSVFKITDFANKDFEKLTQILNQICDAGESKREIYQNAQEYPWRSKNYSPYLGGGNHFFEIDEYNGEYYMVIHSGSYSFGGTVQKSIKKWIIQQEKDTLEKERREKIETLKSQYSGIELGRKIRKLSDSIEKKTEECLITPDVYCEQINNAMWLAHINRKRFAKNVAEKMGWTHEYEPYIESVHNFAHEYVNEHRRCYYVRKGAIAALPGRMVVIHLNMKEGCIVGRVTGDIELLQQWNYSLPHGAGRKMSRTDTRYYINIEKFSKEMKEAGITVGNKCENCIDEAPDAYKNPTEILETIKPLLKDIKVLKPIYNFKR